MAAPVEAVVGPRRRLSLLAGLAIGLVALYAIASLVFVFRGRLNADEGWYLYAGRLVWRGNLPYRDFAFPQMPLTPYVYGLAQILKPSLYLGRLTSVGFGVAAVALAVRVAWREGGRVAGIAVAALCLAFPVGIYNLTLTKTYALSAFLMVAVLAALTSPGRPARTWPIATAAAIGLTLTRTTGLPITLLVVVWCIARAPDTITRRRVIAVTGAGSALLAFSLLVDASAARFNLLTFHNLLWEGADLGSRVDTIVTERIPDWLGEYPGYVALLVATIALVFVSRPVRDYLVRRPGVALVGLGVVGALATQLLTGEWAPVEYVTPITPALLVVAIVLVARAVDLDQGWDRTRVCHVALAIGGVALAVSTVVHPGVGEYFSGSDNPEAVAAANRVGAYVREHTRADDEVLTLWAQPIGFVSGRDQVPGVTVGPFSYEDLHTARAEDLHYVNQSILRRLLRTGRPAAVVITGIDRVILSLQGTYSRRVADPNEVLDELHRHYRLAHHDRGLGIPDPVPVDVYLRRDRQ